MSWPFDYTPYIWPVLASAAFLALLAIYGIRYRTAPGGIPFILMMTGAVVWISANGLGLISTDDRVRIFWWTFQAALLIPLATAELCFGLEYAGLGKWVNRRTVLLLAVVPVAFLVLTFTNEIHHLVWRRLWFDGYIRFIRGPANWGAAAYIYFLSLLHLLVLAWLFSHSPRHRRITAGLIFASLTMRIASFLNIINRNPVEPVNPLVLVMGFAMLPYALALFRFHMFDVVPVARDTVIRGMTDGMLVLDAEDCIVDLNPAAQKIFGIDRSRAIGRRAAEVLDAFPDLSGLVRNPGEIRPEVSLGHPPSRSYHISLATLTDRRGFQLGRLVSLHDITEQKRAQRQALDQQKTLAMLNERELLARELHDGLGQSLAAAYLQAKSAAELLSRGDTAGAESCLHRLSEAILEANESVREYLRGVKTRSSPEQTLFTTLRRYLQQYSHRYGIPVALVVPPKLEEERINVIDGVQLQTIIQEALTNVRKHSGASAAQVVFARNERELQVTVEDDGRGFDPETIVENQGFGLRSMRGRAEALGARLEVSASPGKGTRVIVRMPRRKESQ